MDFSSKTVLVSGAAGNLGQAVAALLAECGANLVLLGRQREKLDALYRGNSERQLLLAVDLLDQTAVQAAVDAAVKQFGRIDILCNLSGGFSMGKQVHMAPQSDWDAMMDVNVHTLLNMVRAVVPGMLQSGGGSIVNVAAQSALEGVANMGPYCVAKSAVIRLTESMSKELKGQNIRVNCVLPSIIDTPENRAAMPHANPAHWIAPRDLAQVIAFLVSDAARAVHGVALPVGGLGA